MTQASLRPPANLQPRPKAVPTFSSTSVAASSTSTPSQASRPSSKSRQASPARSIIPSDVSDRATAALIRRVLCPQSHTGTTNSRSISECLPPLTSSNDVDLQLYAIIAIVVKDLVQSWYGKITPDQGFVEEVVRVVAHCTTQLEGRLRTLDLEGLIFDEIPDLIERHIRFYRISHQSPQTLLSTNPRVIYHSLSPHPALSPVPDPAVPASATEQHGHEAEYRQLLVQGALAVLLPTEDLENACLRTLVADVIADSILGNSIGGKVCEGWFIWDSVTKLVEVVEEKLEPRATGEQMEVDTRSQLEKFGLLADKSKMEKEHNRRSTFSSVFWRVLQYGYLAFMSVRFVILGFTAAYSRPLRSVSVTRTPVSSESSPVDKTINSHHHLPRPILSFRIFPLVSALLDLPSRVPWLSGSLALLQHHLMHGVLKVGGTDGILDQYLHHLFLTTLHPPTLLPQILALARQTLFPNNTIPLTPALPPLSASEILARRHECAISLLSLLPPVACRTVFGSGDPDVWAREVESEVLDVFGDEYLNRHLAYAILELVVVRLLPELAEKGVEELMRERIGK